MDTRWDTIYSFRPLWIRKGKGIYLALFFGMTVVGCLGELADIWRIADICNELLAIPNLLCLFLLRKQVISLTGTYLSDKLRKKH